MDKNTTSEAEMIKNGSGVRPDDKKKTIHGLFEEQVLKYPQAEAVVFKGRSFSYNQMNSRANYIAAELSGAGHGAPGDVIAVLMERSDELIAALLGILKAGCIYLPVDPGYPAERIAYMLENARVKAVITANEHKQSVESIFSNTVFTMENLRGENPDNPSVPVSSEDLAYIIYTSGSTGKPKGVMVEHRSFLNMIFAQIAAFRLTEKSRVLQFASHSFDASVSEIFMALLSGNTLCIADKEVIGDFLAFHSFLEKHKITTATLPPSYLSNLIFDRLTTLKVLITAGEKPNIDDAAALSAKLDYFNAYGPTEASVCASFYKVDPDGVYDKTIPIGKAIPNTAIYIMDEQNRPVAQGDFGELCIAGAGLARGYIHNRELTDLKFIDNPANPGERLYKTGDMGRLLPDGTIEFSRRMDDQVKIRGFRIELGEIEACMQQHRGIKENIVLVKENGLHEKNLVAYGVPDKAWVSGIDDETYAEFLESVAETLEVSDDEKGAVFEDITDETFNITGWKSSYSGEDIPENQMREWVDNTVERILSFNPGHVLEIGCGMGLLLFRIAGKCKSYTATDLSRNAVEYVNKVLFYNPNRYPETKVLRKMADNFEGFEPGVFDTVVINSVVQYFPGINYLTGVITNAAKLLKGKGTIFIGDVRNYNLLPLFQTRVLADKNSRDLSRAEAAGQLEKQLFLERELTVSPEYFYTLKDHIPGLTHVEIRLKKETCSNEMTDYRYDAVLHIEKETVDQPMTELKWGTDAAALEDVKKILDEAESPLVKITGIRNSRTYKTSLVRDLLASDEEISFGKILEKAEEQKESHKDDYVDPLSFLELAGGDYRAEILWAGKGKDLFYDVVFVKSGLFDEKEKVMFPPAGINSFLLGTGGGYANNPRRSQIQGRMVSSIKEHLCSFLPDYMIPSHIVFLTQFKLTINGKIDKKVLPDPFDTARSGEYETAATDIEKRVAAIYREVLRVETIGITDNFFDLGGHSLASARIAARISEEFKRPFPVEHIFTYPDVKGIARLLSENQPAEKEQKPLFLKGITKADPGQCKKVIPLRHTQLMFWIVYKVEKETTNVASAFTIEGELDCTLFASAFNLACQRHTPLFFTFSKNMPLMVRKEPFTIELPIYNLINCAAEEGAIREKELINEVLHVPFNLYEGPMVRAALVKKEKTKTLFLLSFPHIISDVGAVTRFMEELCLIYDRLSGGKRPDLPEPALHIEDLAMYERREDYRKLSALDEQYWKEKLIGAPNLSLPMDYFLEEVTPTGTTLLASLEFPESRMERLGDISKQYSTSLQMAMLSIIKMAFYLLLEQGDFCISMALDSAVNDEAKEVFTMHAYPLMVRYPVTGQSGFTDVLKGCKEFILSGLDHLRCPYLVPYSFANTDGLKGGFDKAYKKASFVSKIITFFMGKARLNRTIFSAFSLMAQGNLSYNRKSYLAARKKRELKSLDTMTPLFNILPDFYEDNRIETESGPVVKPLNDMRVTMPDAAFEGNGESGDARGLNLYLTRNRQNVPVLNIFGGGLTGAALEKIKDAIGKVTAYVVANPLVTLSDIKADIQKDNLTNAK